MRFYNLATIFLAFNWMSSQSFTPFPESYNRLVQGVSFTPDGSVLFCTLPFRERGEAKGIGMASHMPRLAIYRSTLENGSWGEPKLLEFSGQYEDYEPTLSPNGELLFFNSDRPLKDDQKVQKNSIWFSELEQGIWKEPQSLMIINRADTEQSYPTISRKGKLIYCKEVVMDGKSGFFLFETHFTGSYTEVGRKISFSNFDGNTSDPWLSPNEDYLIFTGFNVDDWPGTCDLYISFFWKDQWNEPIGLKELNSEGPDFSPTISPDGKWIYYRKNYEFIKFPFRKLLKKYRRINKHP